LVKNVIGVDLEGEIGVRHGELIARH
jgi:hypothetical protein